MDVSKASNYRRERLRGLFRLRAAAISAFSCARSILASFCFRRFALVMATLLMPMAQTSAAIPKMADTGIDTSIGPMEWLVLSLWVFALCFLANIVFHWIYVPLIDWISDRVSKGGQQ